MGSSEKTSLGLNKWTGQDKPKRDDFNEDNRIIDEEINTAIQIANRIYDGIDLQEKFQSEIFNGYTTPWEWIADRIDMAFYKGLNVHDYIPWKSTNGYAIKSDIAGIDTYYDYGDVPVGHHIDFISRDCYPNAKFFNRVNYNNGTTVSPSPFLASEINAWLNSLTMSVPNATTANPALIAVDYTTTGVYDKLPTALKNVIITKRAMLPNRYTTGSLLIDDNSWTWQNVGKLWLPSELEIYGCNMWGSNLNPNQGFGSGGFVQYPIFSNSMKRIKGAGDGGYRVSWWLSSVMGGFSTHATHVGYTGVANSNLATAAVLYAPLCFRIA